MTEIVTPLVAVAAGNVRPNKAIKAITEQQSLFYAKFAEVSRRNMDRMQGEWMQAWDCLFAVNSAARPVDKAKIYREWLIGVSRRRAEDVAYAFETARLLAGVELRTSMGLVTREDQKASLAA